MYIRDASAYHIDMQILWVQTLSL